MRRALAVILFVFEPFLTAGLLLRISPTLADRDAATYVALAARILLALTSVAAAIGLRACRPYATALVAAVLASSASFALIQHFTRVLPTSVPPDLSPYITGAIVAHHLIWLVALTRHSDR